MLVESLLFLGAGEKIPGAGAGPAPQHCLQRGYVDHVKFKTFWNWNPVSKIVFLIIINQGKKKVRYGSYRA